MTRDEIRHLLPLYAAGTLSAEERDAVEEELRRSPDLREEYREWESIRNVVVASAEYAALHLAPAVIVSFAEGNLIGAELDVAASHLKNCAACANELDIVRKTLAVPDHPLESARTTSQHIGIRKKIAVLFTMPKARWAFAVAVLGIICLFIFFPHIFSPRQTDLSIDLTYIPVLRGESPLKTPTIVLSPGLERIRFTIHLPLSGIAGTRYSIAVLTPPLNATIQLPETLVTLTQTNSIVTVQLFMGVDFFGLQGHYEFIFKEEFHSIPEGVEPRSYSVPFETQLPQ